jgi:hypothetical protein
MRAKDYSVTQVLIGTHRIGLVGLRACLQLIDESGLEDREAIVDQMMEELSASNFIPDARTEEYRTAVWREYLRHRREDFSEFYSEIPVIIRGGTDENRDRLARMTVAALAEHELRPSMTIEPAFEEGSELVLEINGEEVVRGLPTLNGLRKAVRHRLSDW